MKNYLTIDVEDYYQVSGFEKVVDYRQWDKYESRVVENTREILDIFREAGDKKATFFTLGWVGEKYPELVKEIDKEGHEIACHSYYHRSVYNLSPGEFREDVKRSKGVLEDITGKAVIGYRAPSYSVTRDSLWALDILEELEFTYDSSIFPVVHDRYGIPDAPRFKYSLPGLKLVEYPLTTIKILGRNFPVSGGGYFRILPYSFTRYAFKKVNRENEPIIFYLHPWEIDPQQPRMNGVGGLARFRHYYNLENTKSRLKQLLKDFDFGSIASSLGAGD